MSEGAGSGGAEPGPRPLPPAAALPPRKWRRPTTTRCGCDRICIQCRSSTCTDDGRQTSAAFTWLTAAFGAAPAAAMLPYAGAARLLGARKATPAASQCQEPRQGPSRMLDSHGGRSTRCGVLQRHCGRAHRPALPECLQLPLSAWYPVNRTTKLRQCAALAQRLRADFHPARLRCQITALCARA